MGLLALYARKEPTTDAVTIARGVKGKRDSVLYRDRECTRIVARWPWYASDCPGRGQQRVMFNCWRWHLVWCDDPIRISISRQARPSQS